MNKKERIYSIDLFRFIAACGIVCAHYLFRGYKADNFTSLNLTDLGGEWVKYCFVFVDLFFIISGFVIALSLKNISLNQFLKSRFLRIFSVYWFCLLITYTVTLFFGAPRFTANLQQLLVNFTLLQEVFNIPHIDGAYWTMFVELKFYCLAMVFLYLHRYKKLNLQKLVYWWIALSVFYLPVQDLPLIKFIDFFLIFEWSSTFAAGIIMAEIYRTKRIRPVQVIAICFCFGLSVIHRLDYVAESRIYYNTELSDTTTLIAMLAIYILMLLAIFRKLKWLNKPYFKIFGLITYPLYLLHQNIGYIIFNNLEGSVNRYIILGGTIALILLLSFIIVKWFTLPLKMFTDKLYDSSVSLAKKLVPVRLNMK